MEGFNEKLIDTVVELYTYTNLTTSENPEQTFPASAYNPDGLVNNKDFVNLRQFGNGVLIKGFKVVTTALPLISPDIQKRWNLEPIVYNPEMLLEYNTEHEQSETKWKHLGFEDAIIRNLVEEYTNQAESEEDELFEISDLQDGCTQIVAQNRIAVVRNVNGDKGVDLMYRLRYNFVSGAENYAVFDFDPCWIRKHCLPILQKGCHPHAKFTCRKDLCLLEEVVIVGNTSRRTEPFGDYPNAALQNGGLFVTTARVSNKKYIDPQQIARESLI